MREEITSLTSTSLKYHSKPHADIIKVYSHAAYIYGMFVYFV